jgi:hypothetical protein
MSTAPKIKTDPLYRMLREGRVDAFNQEKARGKSCDLTHCDFRGTDLRGLDAIGLDFSGSYFRQADSAVSTSVKPSWRGPASTAPASPAPISPVKSLQTKYSCRSCTVPACVIAAKEELIPSTSCAGGSTQDNDCSPRSRMRGFAGYHANSRV